MIFISVRIHRWSSKLRRKVAATNVAVRPVKHSTESGQEFFGPGRRFFGLYWWCGFVILDWTFLCLLRTVQKGFPAIYEKWQTKIDASYGYFVDVVCGDFCFPRDRTIASDSLPSLALYAIYHASSTRNPKVFISLMYCSRHSCIRSFPWHGVLHLVGSTTSSRESEWSDGRRSVSRTPGRENWCEYISGVYSIVLFILVAIGFV